MKNRVPFLKKGDQILAKVIERIDQNTLIMSFQGDLLRVQDHSQVNLNENDMVLLQVKSTHPLRFEIDKVSQVSGALPVRI